MGADLAGDDPRTGRCGAQGGEEAPLTAAGPRAPAGSARALSAVEADVEASAGTVLLEEPGPDASLAEPDAKEAGLAAEVSPDAEPDLPLDPGARPSAAEAAPEALEGSIEGEAQ